MPDLHSEPNPYIQDILAQPTALRATLDALADAGPFQPFADRLRSGSLKRVVLTGMGSSYYGQYPLFLTLVEYGIPAVWLETSELIHYTRALLQPDTLLIGVSQSGRSAEIQRLVEQVGGQVPLIGVTNTAGSPLAVGADTLLLTRAGEESSVSCKTYTSALAALGWLGAMLTGGDPAASLADFERVPQAMAAYLGGLDDHVAALKKRLSDIDHLILVGRGPSLAAVGEGALIIKEAARFPAEGMSCAAYRHGPLEMTTPQQAILVYAGAAPTHALNLRLAADVETLGGRALVVDQDAAVSALTLPAVPPAALSLVEILPAQMVSIALAQIAGHEAGQLMHTQKVTVEE